MGHSENFNKVVKNIRKYQTEVIMDLKNTVKGFNSRLDEVEEQTSKLEDKAMELTQIEQQIEKKKSEKTLIDLWDNIKQNSFCITGVPEGDEGNKGPEKLFEEMRVIKLSNLRKKKTSRSRNPNNLK